MRYNKTYPTNLFIHKNGGEYLNIPANKALDIILDKIKAINTAQGLRDFAIAWFDYDPKYGDGPEKNGDVVVSIYADDEIGDELEEYGYALAKCWCDNDVEAQAIIQNAIESKMAEVGIDYNGDDDTVPTADGSNFSDALVAENLTEASTGGWLDAIDNAETASDVYAIPQWALDKASVTRSDLLRRVQRTYGPKKTYASSSTPATKDYTNEAAAKAFWAMAKDGVIDYDSFHAAYDDALKAAGANLTDLFPRGDELGWMVKWPTIDKLDSSLASVRALRKVYSMVKKDNPSLKKKKEREADEILRKKQLAIMPMLREIGETDEDVRRIVYVMDMRDGSFSLYDDYALFYDDDYDWPGGYAVDLQPGAQSREPEELVDEIVANIKAGKYQQK